MVGYESQPLPISTKQQILSVGTTMSDRLGVVYRYFADMARLLNNGKREKEREAHIKFLLALQLRCPSLYCIWRSNVQGCSGKLVTLEVLQLLGCLWPPCSCMHCVASAQKLPYKLQCNQLHFLSVHKAVLGHLKSLMPM